MSNESKTVHIKLEYFTDSDRQHHFVFYETKDDVKKIIEKLLAGEKPSEEHIHGGPFPDKFHAEWDAGRVVRRMLPHIKDNP